MSLQDKLKEIEDRANAATGGPWYPLNNYGTHILEPSLVFGETGIIAKGSEAFIGQRYLASVTDIEKLDNNLRFIAHARSDIPKLLAVIKLLIEKNEGWCRLYHKHAAMYYNEEYSEQSIIEDMASDRLEIAKILEDEK